MSRPVEIYCEAGSRLGDGTMKDISARGARIADCPGLAVAQMVVLCLPDEGVRWPCEVVRMSDREIGVEFL